MSTTGFRKLRHRDKSMRFGLFWPYSRTLIPSATIASRNPDVLDLQNHVKLAQAIETAGLDFALIADGYAPASEDNSRVGFQDPSTNAVILAVPLIMATSRLGFISTMHTTFLHPVVIARLGAHLDWISGGRWGWNIVNGFRDHEARLFGFDGRMDHDGGYDQADEAVQVIKALWANPPGGIDHEGPRFKVKGRIRRPVPATVPLLVSAASSARGRIFAAKNCDYLFATPTEPEDVIDITADLEKGAAAAGRNDTPQILILSDVLIRDEPGRARAEYAELTGTIDDAAQKVWSSHLANVTHGKRKPGELMTFLGTPAEVAEQIIELHRATGITGLVLRLPLWSADEAVRLGPVLQQVGKAGIWLQPAQREYSW
jgi:alkanesulfonate monooxygenase SsuD/methylene tetrahydromethanopterin reductase-like flavin-dependent oxidoreductase (luciferase family)